MKKITKFFKEMFLLSILAAFTSCNNNADTTNVEADTAAVQTTVSQTEFIPFDVALLTHTVKDYAKWRPFYNADSVARKASGLEELVVAQELEKPNSIMMAYKVSDIQKAKDLAASPQLKEKMQDAGVTSKPDFTFFNVIRFNPDAKEKQWVDVTHKVKDFDAWLKVFDAEGTAGRAAEGLYDAILARGVEDSNIVHLVFNIKDMAKAKTSIFSEEKKKLMMSAGVEGTPKIVFYKMPE